MIATLISKQVQSACNALQPLLIALVGSNGCGKSTLYKELLTTYQLPLVNADEIGRQISGRYLSADDPFAYEAMKMADKTRYDLVHLRRSFIMETVLSDTVGSKLAFFKQAKDSGYWLFVIYIRLENAEISSARVMQRVIEGGHDVASTKLHTRFPRTQANAVQALRLANFGLVLDNSSFETPFAFVEAWQDGTPLRG
jgi:predicted ABC-type ATPase